jgi:hypothetical protein
MTIEELEVLNAALMGYQQQLNEINEKILDINRMLDGKPNNGNGGRHISAEGRARIAEAQRKRWAAVRKGKKKTTK